MIKITLHFLLQQFYNNNVPLFFCCKLRKVKENEAKIWDTHTHTQTHTKERLKRKCKDFNTKNDKKIELSRIKYQVQCLRCDLAVTLFRCVSHLNNLRKMINIFSWFLLTPVFAFYVVFFLEWMLMCIYLFVCLSVCLFFYLLVMWLFAAYF